MFHSTAMVAGAALVGSLIIAPTASAPPASALPEGIAPAAAPGGQSLTNLAHLDFLLDDVSPEEIAGHTTYRLAEEPELTMPWTYADARDGGTFERVGGGPLDPATGYWGQGAYNADDVSRAAVVYLRHWQQTGSETSKEHAYELLRSLAYFQTTTGQFAGNVVLWMQPDGTLNPSPEPVELPDPSDSGDSYWLARTLWALGEGYAAFAPVDSDFAEFLQQRLQLGVEAVDREVLGQYGQYLIADGAEVPAWLIAGGADASAEAILGLAAYVSAAPDDAAARTALEQLAEGVAAMRAGDITTWPYGAILPWTESRSLWHAWGSQMPAALAEASVALADSRLLAPAIADSTGFTTTLITAGGPDNAWLPAPIDQVQIAYGADSRLQSLLAVGDAAHASGLLDLAGFVGAWYFGANRSGAPVYNPETGVTFDGVQPDGTVNRNSGAESTIHGLLSMLALDAHPTVAVRAQSISTIGERDGLRVVEAESASTTTGSVVTPESAWTGESQFSGGAYLRLLPGQSATIALTDAAAAARGGGRGAPGGPGAPGKGSDDQVLVEPVVNQPTGATARSQWKAGAPTIGVLAHGVGAQGVTAAPGALLPQPLKKSTPDGGEITVRALAGTVELDALFVRPVVARVVYTGGTASAELAHSNVDRPIATTMGTEGITTTVRVYDATGSLVKRVVARGSSSVQLPPGGFATATTG
ncbi:hypothetical protein [Homoserinimonas hongtaonis]|uniref:hypothetical protein n=1 Tax=Homoserinimonas hongtaonis TaxID=2079791 RepID=UPI001F5447AF|nr:hypothetical protein [Salinibacterium hongtaonis]